MGTQCRGGILSSTGCKQDQNLAPTCLLIFNLKPPDFSGAFRTKPTHAPALSRGPVAPPAELTETNPLNKCTVLSTTSFLCFLFFVLLLEGTFAWKWDLEELGCACCSFPTWRHNPCVDIAISCCVSDCSVKAGIMAWGGEWAVGAAEYFKTFHFYVNIFVKKHWRRNWEAVGSLSRVVSKYNFFSKDPVVSL